MIIQYTYTLSKHDTCISISIIFFSVNDHDTDRIILTHTQTHTHKYIYIQMLKGKQVTFRGPNLQREEYTYIVVYDYAGSLISGVRISFTTFPYI